MSISSTHARALGRPKVVAPMIDDCAIMPIAACVFALIAYPLLSLINSPPSEAVLSGTYARSEPRIFWPVMAAISVLLAIKYRSRLAKLTWPPHLICLLVCVGFAGVSVLWAFRPEISFVRFVQELMIVISIVLPAMLAARTSDIMRALFLCFAFASILNIFFVLGGTATIVINANSHGSYRDYLGSPGYFSFKNYLGECAAIAFLLSLYEIRHHGVRRGFGIVIALIAIYLTFSSDSKTALGLALIAPILAGVTLITRRITRISPAVILLSIPFCVVVLSSVSHFTMALLSYKIYGDGSFTGRTVIWDFAQNMIEQRPLLGWGYLSFWLVPGSPSGNAPGWVKMMPNAHNGYYDTILQMGYLGLACLMAFIIATLHAIGRVADRDPARAWLVLSLSLFIIIYNGLETLWMQGFEFLWLVFVIVAADIGRYWRPLPLARAAYGSRSPRPTGRSPARGAETPRPGISTMRKDAESRSRFENASRGYMP
jgi:exopolysaccharide production protein ExoQ